MALRQFDECGAFLDYVHTEGAERVGAYGFDNQQYWLGMDDVMVMEAATASSHGGPEASGSDGTPPTSRRQCPPRPRAGGTDESAAGGESGTDFSTTNVQVEGVDEPDIVKTDGTRILALSENGVLHYVDIDDDGAAGTKRGSVSISDAAGPDGYSYGQEILVSGDRAFVITRGESGFPGPVPMPVEEVFVDEVAPEQTTTDRRGGRRRR